MRISVSFVQQKNLLSSDGRSCSPKSQMAPHLDTVLRSLAPRVLDPTQSVRRGSKCLTISLVLSGRIAVSAQAILSSRAAPVTMSRNANPKLRRQLRWHTDSCKIHIFSTPRSRSLVRGSYVFLQLAWQVQQRSQCFGEAPKFQLQLAKRAAAWRRPNPSTSPHTGSAGLSCR